MPKLINCDLNFSCAAEGARKGCVRAQSDLIHPHFLPARLSSGAWSERPSVGRELSSSRADMATNFRPNRRARSISSLQKRKASDAVHYADVWLAVIKLMGPGESVLSRPGDKNQSHVDLAALYYTDSTAPNPASPTR